MTPKEREYFSGNTLDHALMQAARHHGLQPQEIAYEKIEKRHGFLNARRGIVIKVNPESPRRAADEDAPTVTPKAGPEVPSTAAAAVVEPPPVPEPEDPPGEAGGAPEEQRDEPESLDARDDPERGRAGEDEAAGIAASDEATDSDLLDAAKRGLQEILEFAKLDLTFEITQGDGQLDIELTGPDREFLIEDRGNLLLAIQHLMPRLIRGHAGRSTPCHVDSENFHETREVELRELAEGAAAGVRKEQRPRTLPPMNPAERRIIHVTLADEKDLNTESLGKGFFKRITISPAKRRP